jgi:acetyl-CoA acetyltransferase
MPLPHLRKARNETQKAIEDLKKAAEALRRSMEGAGSTPVRQRHVDVVATHLANTRAEKARIERLIEELERDA